MLPRYYERFCNVCGDPHATPVAINFNGELAFTVLQCRACITRNDVDLAIIRGEFHTMLEQGVSARMANRIQRVRIDGLMRSGAFGPPDA